MLDPGQRIGDYEVVALVAHGGMAAVYRVVDVRDQSIWALKMLILKQPGMAERFRGEASLHASLQHPNVVRARELLELDGQMCIVMEYVDGPGMDRWLRSHTGASFELRHTIALQIVEAIRAAHSQGLIHRDLKPGNVLIAGTDEAPVIKITDFGLAKQQGFSELTKSGVALGTPRYMAPEQVRDAKRVDHRADIFALGALLYELYTNRPAFAHDSFLDVCEALTEADYVDPAVFGVPDAPSEAIRAALRPEAADRPADCGVLLRILEGLPPEPGPEPPDVSGELPPALARALSLLATARRTLPPEILRALSLLVSVPPLAWYLLGVLILAGGIGAVWVGGVGFVALLMAAIR